MGELDISDYGTMDIKLTKILLDSEYPMRWNVRNDLESIPESMIRRLLDQLTEKLYEPEHQLEQIMNYIGLAYEYFVEGKIDDALETVSIGENRLKGTITDSCVAKLLPALQHITFSIKLHLLKLKNEFQAAVDASSEIPKISDLNVKNRAALHGLKAVFYSEYGINGSKKALKFAEKAIELDNEESFWHFLKGKYMGRIRRVEMPYDPPTDPEISSLEKSMKLELNPSYTVFTAQVYREAASRVYRKYCLNHVAYPQLKTGIDKLNEESVKLYKQSLELKPECPHMAFRCAKGFMLLPLPYRDVDIAKELLKKGLRAAPQSGYGNHTMAQYYERVKKDLHSAIGYLKICHDKKIFGASMDMIRLEHRLDKNPTHAIATLEEMYDYYTETARKTQILSQLCSFHVFSITNLVKACQFASKILRLNPKCDDMVQHRPIAVYTVNPIMMYDVLIDEIKIKLQEKDCLSADRQAFKDFLTDLLDLNLPDVVSVKSTPPQNLKNKILADGTRMQPKMFDTKQVPLRKGVGNRVSKQVPSQLGRSKMNVPTLMKKTEEKLDRDQIDEKMKAFGEACRKTVFAAKEKTMKKFYSSSPTGKGHRNESTEKKLHSVSQNKKADQNDDCSEDDFNQLALTAFKQAKETCVATEEKTQNEKKPSREDDSDDVTKMLEKLSLVNKSQPLKKDKSTDDIDRVAANNRASESSKKQHQNRRNGKDKDSSNHSDYERRPKKSEYSSGKSRDEGSRYSRSGRRVPDEVYRESRNRAYKIKHHDDECERSRNKSYDSEIDDSESAKRYEKYPRDKSSRSDSVEYCLRNSRSKSHRHRDYSGRRLHSKNRRSDSEGEYSKCKRSSEKYCLNKSSKSDSKSDRRRRDSEAKYSKSRRSYEKSSRDWSSASDSGEYDSREEMRSRSEKKYRDDNSDRRRRSRSRGRNSENYRESRRHSNSRRKHRQFDNGDANSSRNKRYDFNERQNDIGNETGRETVLSNKSIRSVKTPSQRSDYSHSRKYYESESSHKHRLEAKPRHSKYEYSEEALPTGKVQKKSTDGHKAYVVPQRDKNNEKKCDAENFTDTYKPSPLPF